MSKPVPTYNEYVDVYGGRLDEDGFNANLRLACLEIDDLCMGKDVPEASEDAYKAAICSVMDIYAENGYSPVESFSVGSFSMQGGSQSAQQFARSHARKILFPTGLLYAGIG